MKGLSVEVRVGLLILAALLLLGGFIFVLGGVQLGDRYDLFVDFDHPGNVQPGAPVSVGSIRIGTVEEVRYMGGRLDPETGRRPLIRMRLSIDENVRDTIHEDALFYVTSQSVLGESVIAIDPGDPEKPPLPPEAVVEGVDPPRLDLALALAYELLEGLTRFLRENRQEFATLLTSAASMVRQIDGLLSEHDERLDTILANIEQATAQTNELLEGGNEILHGPHLRRSLANLDRTLAAVASDIGPLMHDVRSLAGSAEETFGPQQREQIQHALAHAASLATEADSAVADARAIVAHIREGRGSVGAFVMDEEVYDDVQELLRDLKHNPWKLFWRE